MFAVAIFVARTGRTSISIIACGVTGTAGAVCNGFKDALICFCIAAVGCTGVVVVAVGCSLHALLIYAAQWRAGVGVNGWAIRIRIAYTAKTVAVGFVNAVACLFIANIKRTIAKVIAIGLIGDRMQWAADFTCTVDTTAGVTQRTAVTVCIGRAVQRAVFVRIECTPDTFDTGTGRSATRFVLRTFDGCMHTGLAGWAACVDRTRQAIFAFLIGCTVNRWAIFHGRIDAFSEETSILCTCVVVRAIACLCAVTRCAVVNGCKDTACRGITGVRSTAVVVVAILGLVGTFFGAKTALAERQHACISKIAFICSDA